MIAALNNITTSNGPGATTGQSARVREADDPSTTSQAEASAVVSLSPQAASLAASGAAAPAQAAQSATGPAAAVQTATAQPVTAAPAAQPAVAQTAAQAAEEQAAAQQASARQAAAQAAEQQIAARAASAPTTVTAQSTSFQPSNARAAVTPTEEKFPEPISLVPNLVYAEADSDQNGVISPAERRAYDVVHPTLGQRPADVPPKRVVDAELREYTAIANNQF